jgi:hypothetical protein
MSDLIRGEVARDIVRQVPEKLLFAAGQAAMSPDYDSFYGKGYEPDPTRAWSPTGKKGGEPVLGRYANFDEVEQGANWAAKVEFPDLQH